MAASRPVMEMSSCSNKIRKEVPLQFPIRRSVCSQHLSAAQHSNAPRRSATAPRHPSTRPGERQAQPQRTTMCLVHQSTTPNGAFQLMQRAASSSDFGD